MENYEKQGNGVPPEPILPNENRLNDLTLKVIGGDIHCNKSKMMESSEFFRGMFESEMKEAKSDCVQMQETDVETLSAVVDFCMTGRIEISSDNVYSVAELACKYQVPRLISMCSFFLRDSMTAENCLSTMFFAETFFLKEAYNKCKIYVLWNFMNLIHTEEFLEMEACHLKTIIDNPQLNVRCELETLKAVLRWINHRRTERIGLLPEILQETKLLDFCCDADLDFVKNCTDIIENCGGEFLSKLNVVQNCERKMRCIPYQLISVGAYVEDDDDDDENKMKPHRGHLVSYDVDTGQTMPYTETPKGCLASHDVLMEKKGYKACVQGEKIFVSGGENTLGKNTWMMTVWCYSSLEKSWSEVAKLKTPRRHHAMCTLGESSLLLMGGFGRYRYRLDSVEEWNCQTKKWYNRAPLPERMVNISACRCKEKAFVTRNKCITNLFSYCPQSDQWTSLPLPCSIFGDLDFGSNRIWMIPDNELLYIGLGNADVVLKFNTITNRKVKCSLFNDSKEISDSLTYDFFQLIPKHLNDTGDIFQALKKKLHIQGNLCRDKLCSFFVCFVKNEVFALPYFPD